MAETARVLVTTNGRRLQVDGARLLVVDVGTSRFSLLLLVLGFVLTLSSLFTLTYLSLGIVGAAPWPIGVVSAAVAVVFGFLIWLVVRTRRRREQRPAGETPTIVVFDLDSQRLLSGLGTPLAALDTVVVRRRRFTTFGTIARLVVEWPGGSIELVREDIFDNGFDDFCRQLSSRGVDVRRSRFADRADP